MNRFKTFFKILEWEALFWVAGLVFLLFLNPYQSQQFTFCPIHNLGLEFCPGCGLGRSISFFYSGDISNSFKSHPLGIIAFFIIFFRIITLLKKMLFNFNTNKEVLYG